MHHWTLLLAKFGLHQHGAEGVDTLIMTAAVSYMCEVESPAAQRLCITVSVHMYGCMIGSYNPQVMATCDPDT